MGCSCSSNFIDLAIVLVQVFLSELPRGIVVPTLFPYVRATKTANPELVASLAVSAFSVGRLLSSYPLGLLADNTGSSRLSLMIGTVVVIIFNTVFAFAGLMGPTVAPFLIIISRLLVGFGSGTLGVARAFMARISTPEERLKYVMYNTLLQYIGFSISPILADLVSYLFHNNSSNPLVQYGLLPGLTTTGLSIVMLILLFGMSIKDPNPSVGTDEGIDDTQTPTTAEKDKTAAITTEEGMIKSKPQNIKDHKLFACFLLYMFLNFSLRGVLGVLETYGANLFQQIKSPPGKHARADVVRQSGEFFVYMGVIGVFVLLLLPRISKRFTPYWTLLFGILCIAIGSTFFLPLFFQSNFVYFTVAVVLIWSFGSPITQTLTISTYSQMMGSKPQGAVMGWLTTAGSLGRIIFPILAGISYDATTYINVIFAIIAGVSAVAFRFIFGSEA